MPEPTIDALPVDLGRHSAALLGLGLELGLEAGELGERGIRIGLLFAVATIEPGRPRRPAVLLAARNFGTLTAVLAVRGAAPVARRSAGPARCAAWRRLGRGLRALRLWLAGRVFRRCRPLGSRWSVVLTMPLARPPTPLAPCRPPYFDQHRIDRGRNLLRCAFRGCRDNRHLLRRARRNRCRVWRYGGDFLRLSHGSRNRFGDDTLGVDGLRRWRRLGGRDRLIHPGRRCKVKRRRSS